MTEPVRHLTDAFAVLKPSLDVEAVPLSPEVYAELDARFDGFRSHVLIALHRFTADWPTWESHPHGDEVVVLIDGAATFLIRTDDGDETLSLSASGEYVIVPRGRWHTAQIATQATMLFITPGEGTENVESPPDR